MSGADADALDGLARQLGNGARRVTNTRNRLGPTIHSSPWNGRSADRFRHDWSTEHSRALAEASSFLAHGSDVLRRNADEQRNASAEGGGRLASPAVHVARAPGGNDADAVRDFLLGMGLSLEQVKALLDKLGGYADLLGKINELLENDALTAFLKGAGQVLDAAGDLVDILDAFFTDFAEHAHLPVDEAIVHAVAEVGVRMAVSKGAETAIQYLTPVLMSVIPVAGTAGGVVVGKVVGYVIGKVVKAAVDKVDEQINLYDGGADVALDGYRYLKERDFAMTDIAIDAAREAGGRVIDGAQNVVESVGDTVENAVSRFNPFD